MFLNHFSDGNLIINFIAPYSNRIDTRYKIDTIYNDFPEKYIVYKVYII